MLTQKAFIRGHKKYLNKKFVEEHPKGQFVIQRRNCGYVNIYVNFRRRTSGGHWLYPYGFGIEHCGNTDFYFVNGQNNGLDRVTTYKTLEKFLAGCNRFLVTEEAVYEFLFFYNNRSIPGFTDKVKENIYFCTKNHVSTVPSRRNAIWRTNES